VNEQLEWSISGGRTALFIAGGLLMIAGPTEASSTESPALLRHPKVVDGELVSWDEPEDTSMPLFNSESAMQSGGLRNRRTGAKGHQEKFSAENYIVNYDETDPGMVDLLRELENESFEPTLSPSSAPTDAFSDEPTEKPIDLEEGLEGSALLSDDDYAKLTVKAQGKYAMENGQEVFFMSSF
jgi:hypothetical protein